MKITSIKRASGQVAELESEDALTINDIREALGETDQNLVIEQLTKLVEELVKQGGAKPPVINVAASPVNVAAPEITVTAPAAAPAQVNVSPQAPKIDVHVDAPKAAAASPQAWNVSVTERDRDGRIKSLQFTPWVNPSAR